MMHLFKSKYRARIEAKIVELVIQHNLYKDTEEKISILEPKERIHFVILRKDCEKQIELLRSLLNE